MKKLVAVTSMILTTFSVQAADLYLYAGAGLKEPLVCASVLAWSRAIGEFGATLMLAGATRFKTETLPMAVYLNISSGDFEIAIGASLWLLFISTCLLLVLRMINRAV